MAGTPIGKIDCDITSTLTNGNQEAFKNTFDFFELMVAAGWATRLALQWGNAGTGTDYHDGANPFGQNAFALYRMNGATSGNVDSDRDGVTLADFDYYVLIQWAELTFGIAPGDPGLLNNSSATDGIGIAVAVREDGSSPWGGSTANDGTDSKGATVWTDGGSTVHVFPTSNGLGGQGYSVTNKEDMRQYCDMGNSGGRMHMVGDADAFVLLFDLSDDTSYLVNYYGVYYPIAGLSPSMPLVCLSNNQPTEWVDGSTNTWGSANCSQSQEGGILGVFLSDGMLWPVVGQDLIGMLETVLQPNTEPATAELDAAPIRVAVSTYGQVSYSATQVRGGYVGNLNPNVVLAVDNVATEDTNAALTRAYFGASVVTSIKQSIPWDGVTTPGTTLTRAGVTF